MPQIIIQIGDSPNPNGFLDNDIIHAWNDTFLLWRYTQILTEMSRY